MISKTTRDFWKLFQRLPKVTQWQAVTTYRSWRNHPFHSSLQFKRIGIKVPVYSVRIGANWRALGLLKGNTITWFWIGSHEDYNQVIKCW